MNHPAQAKNRGQSRRGGLGGEEHRRGPRAPDVAARAGRARLPGPARTRLRNVRLSIDAAPSSSQNQPSVSTPMTLVSFTAPSGSAARTRSRMRQAFGYRFRQIGSSMIVRLQNENVLSASRLEPLAPFLLASPAGFSRSTLEPDRASRCLHAGCRSSVSGHPPSLYRRKGHPAVLTSPTQKLAAVQCDRAGAAWAFHPSGCAAHMATNQLSTLRKQFACARLTRSCLSGSWSRLFRDAHDHGF